MNADKLAAILAIPRLSDYLQQVEEEIRQALITAGPELKTPALRIAAGGKRLRPALTIAAAVSNGSKVDDKLIAACAAVELIHIASLCHDDIIDEAASRRGVPTINSQEGAATAILVGDYLIALAGVQAAVAGQKVAHIIASTFATMCDGQSQELSNTFNSNRSVEDYMLTIRKKTAALMGAACRIGGVCAGFSEASVTALAEYGENFGMAFQLSDDLLDITSTSETQGKPVGNDIKGGVYTLPLLLSLGGLSGDAVRSLLSDKSRSAKASVELMNLLRGDGSFEKTLAEARSYNHKAVEALERLESKAMHKGLAEFPVAYLNWALSTTALPKLQA